MNPEFPTEPEPYWTQDAVNERDEADQERRQLEADRQERLTRDQGEWRGVYPGMCRDPELCRGRGSCPRDPSCSE